MNLAERAIQNAIRGLAPAPFSFKGKDHKSPNQQRWERDQEIAKQKKADKQARKRARKQARRQGERTLRRLLKRCRILPGEDASAAKNRSIGESLLPQKAWYRQVYLFSDHWKELRNTVMRVPEPACADCWKSKSLDVHHLNYRNIFDVLPSDLQILCRRCHEKRHGAE